MTIISRKAYIYMHNQNHTIRHASNIIIVTVSVDCSIIISPCVYSVCTYIVYNYLCAWADDNHLWGKPERGICKGENTACLQIYCSLLPCTFYLCLFDIWTLLRSGKAVCALLALSCFLHLASLAPTVSCF